ncbi:EAL domain-containing protein [Paraburkholderia kururiensis]|uniref:EAL domain-containing protein n=1 Tax=Paraburkholderia kururiensis TaxID=984307 RepID=UPI0005A75332|nr:EAL domain-containing protein [Paraburkholderia kururiensis]
MSIVEDRTITALLPHLARNESGWTATWRDYALSSVFQPVLSITHQRVVGYEALTRATDSAGRSVAPETLFAQPKSASDPVQLDPLTRCLHVANFVEQRIETGWLFLNALPQAFETGWPHRAFIEQLCEYFGLPHERVVIEVLEHRADDEAAVAAMAASQPRDFLIAIDDFGTGFSNFDRVWRYRPNIVKLDRSLVTRAALHSADASFISHLVTMLHQAGTLVLAEGVETEEELMVLMRADIDFVQGFWFGQPNASIRAAGAAAPAQLRSMWKRYAAYERRHARHQRPSFDDFTGAVADAGSTFATTGDLEQAARVAFRVGEACRIFVTNESGEQELPSIAAAHLPPPPARLAPLFPDTHSNWSRRDYFRRAIATPGRVAIMGPHCSLTEGADCYTAAVAVMHAGKLHVLCVDFLGEPPRTSRQ